MEQQQGGMSMLLAIDVGNSNINVGVGNEGELRFITRIATDKNRTEDQYAVELSAILSLYGTEPSDIDGAVISSVVPSLAPVLKCAVTRLTGCSALMLEPGIKTGLNIHIDNPAQLGADLVAGAVAANAVCQKPCIIFDFGTATKATVLDKSGSLVGCLIMHGVKISLEALASNTAQLPHINLERPSRVIGTNTVDSMRSGAVLGAACMLDGITERIENEIGTMAAVVVTGGLSSLIIPYCRRNVTAIPTLVLDGLGLIYRKNQISDKK